MISICWYPIFYFYFLLHPAFSDISERSRRLDRVLKENRIRKPGRIEIGGLFSIHTDFDTFSASECSGYDFFSLLCSQAMIYEVDRINKDPNILPNITLGYEMLDDCYNTDLSVKGAMMMMMGEDAEDRRLWILKYREKRMEMAKGDERRTVTMKSPKIGLIGPANSDASIAVASLTSVNLMPVISYIASSSELSQKRKYPNFMRTIPSDSIQIEATADLIKYFNWTWISAVGTDDTYGQYAIQALKEELLARNICLAKELLMDHRMSHETVSDTLDDLFSDELSKRVNVIVLLSPGAKVERFLRAAQQRQFFNKTWISSESWGFREMSSDLEDVVGGSLGLMVDVPEASNFIQYMNTMSIGQLNSTNPWLYRFLLDQAYINSTFHSEEWTLSQIGVIIHPFQYSTVATIIDAVRATAVSLHRLIFDQGKPIDSLQPVDLLRALRSGVFTSSVDHTRQYSFDSNGDVHAGYRYTNLKLIKNGAHEALRFVDVGGWTNQCENGKKECHKMNLNTNRITWNSGSTTPPESKCQDDCSPGIYRIYGGSICCWTCQRCPSGEYSETMNSHECRRCPAGLVNNAHHTACVYPSDYADWRSAGEIVALTLAALGMLIDLIVSCILFLHRRTPVVICSNAPLTFILLYLLATAFSLPLFYVIRPSTGLCFAETVLFGWTFSTITAILFTKTFHVLRIFTAKLRHTLHMLSQRGLHRREIWLSLGLGSVILLPSIPYLIIHEPVPLARSSSDCGNHWVNIQLINMAYIALLSLATTYVSFRARNLPENYNEAYTVATTMLMLVLVWVSSVPSYYRVSMANRALILGLSVDAAALCVLVLVFGPKLYVIFRQPHKNTALYVSRMNMIHLWKQQSKRTWNETSVKVENKGRYEEQSMPRKRIEKGSEEDTQQ